MPIFYMLAVVAKDRSNLRGALRVYMKHRLMPAVIFLQLFEILSLTVMCLATDCGEDNSDAAAAGGSLLV
eukprot:scaffold471093_cov36-Prasinocladus_malaysianus.AAC.1